MTLPLRERRRVETAREIQRATLRLAAQRGLEHVTTEAIAEAAGISPRTFFNYYTNKEAASVGQPPPFSEISREELRAGSGPLTKDLKRFLDRHLEDLSDDEDIIRGLGEIVHQSGKVRWLLDQHLRSLREDLADCLAARLPDAPPALRLELADWALQGIGTAIELWLGRDGQPLRGAMDEVWAAKIAAARIIALPAP
ncbi:TetR/AcrR family transcriptional regulator [Mangrovicoccus sp. HB161399]|uniref:TetR/AcrR family transcriptional regulator n=1 Tax=Mangrovicoccus sp. HB161399 TaxID=2720392 RepID=UPI001553528D|nr:TetR/AcrR family transcriptional regulator [Mangrovicoccus sp. HB161399]